MAAPAIGLRPRWAPSPSAVIDWSHPLTVGLLHCIRPVGSAVMDLVSGRPLTVDAPAATGASRFGRALRSSGNASGAYLPLTSAPTYPLTMTYVGDVDFATGTGGAGILMYSWGTGGGWASDAVPYSLGIDYGGSSAIGVNRVNGSLYVGGLSYASAYVSGVISSTIQNGLSSLYVDGILAASASTVLANPTSTNFSGLAFQRHSFPTRTQAASGTLGLVHSRLLTGGELASLAADPFQIFRQ